MLDNVYEALVEVHGFSSTAMDDPSGTEANIVWLHRCLSSRVTPRMSIDDNLPVLLS